MPKRAQELGSGWWAKNLDDVDREVARLATICNVRILDPGVIERVLQNDASVCGTRNPLAFDKLRNALLMHYSVRDRAVDVLGQETTTVLVQNIVERLRKTLGDRLGEPPKTFGDRLGEPPKT